MIRWSLIYGVPALLMLVVWAVYFTVNRARNKEIALWISLLAMASATIPAFAGVYALTHVYTMASRGPTDFTFERVSMVFGLLGAVTGIVWVIRSRRFCSWSTLAVSVWMSLVWGAILKLQN